MFRKQEKEIIQSEEKEIADAYNEGLFDFEIEKKPAEMTAKELIDSNTELSSGEISSYKKEQERAQTNHLNETPSAISGKSLDNLNLSQNNNSVNKKTPFDIAAETGNDVEAIANSLNNSQSFEKNEEYARELADWIIQHGLEMSTEMENYSVSFEDILEYTDTPAGWLNDKLNIELVNQALAEHNDNAFLV